MHGLGSTGLGTSGPDLLRKHVSRQTRIIGKSPAHITHETTQSLFSRLDIPDPVQDLWQGTETRIQKAKTGSHGRALAREGQGILGHSACALS